MQEMQGSRPERHRVMLDVSLFALDLLDPRRISEGASSEFFLEVPGAFVAMIWAARDGESVLSDLIYAYLLKIRRDDLHIESPDQRIQTLVSATGEKLRAIAEGTAQRFIREYASLIEGVVEEPYESEVDSFSNRLLPIRRYDAVIPVTQGTLEKLRKVYFRELGLPPHPLYDLYFLQMYHAQTEGIAASPLTPRQIIAVCGHTFSILKGLLLLTVDRLPPPLSDAEFKRRTQKFRDILRQFIHTRIKPEWVEAALNLAVNMTISVRLDGDPAPVMALVGLASELLLVRALTDHDLKLWQRIIYGAVALVLMAIVAPLLYRLSQPLNDRPMTAVCKPCPTAVGATRPAAEPEIAATMQESQPIPTTTWMDRAAKVEESAPAGGVGFCLYVVQPSDTLQALGARFQVSQADLLAHNELLRKGVFQVHQMLMISAPCCRANSDQGITHIVQRKETLYSIAGRYGTTVERIVKANRIDEPSYIQEGQMLCVP